VYGTWQLCGASQQPLHRQRHEIPVKIEIHVTIITSDLLIFHLHYSELYFNNYILSPHVSDSEKNIAFVKYCVCNKFFKTENVIPVQSCAVYHYLHVVVLIVIFASI